MADTLARLHSLPLPAPGSPIPRQDNPFRTTLDVVEQGAQRFLDKAVPDAGARAEIVEELGLMHEMAATLARSPAAAVDRAGRHASRQLHRRSPTGIAWFVDLEKVHVGSPAIDLAHATLADLDRCGIPMSARSCRRAEVAGLLRHLSRADRRGACRRAANPGCSRCAASPGCAPRCSWRAGRCRREAPRDPSDPSQWSDAGLSPEMRAHLRSRIALSFDRDDDPLDPRGVAIAASPCAASRSGSRGARRSRRRGGCRRTRRGRGSDSPARAPRSRPPAISQVRDALSLGLLVERQQRDVAAGLVGHAVLDRAHVDVAQPFAVGRPGDERLRALDRRRRRSRPCSGPGSLPWPRDRARRGRARRTGAATGSAGSRGLRGGRCVTRWLAWLLSRDGRSRRH